MKKIITFLLIAALAVSAFSCGEKEDDTDNTVKEAPNATEETTVKDEEKNENTKNPMPENAAPDACGEDLTWRFDKDTETLRIEGNGDMWDFIAWDEEDEEYYVKDQPWKEFEHDIDTVVIENGVTSIGYGAFYFHNVSIINIPESVTSIGEYAFTANQWLKSINVSSDNKNYCDTDGVLFTKDQKTLICYPPNKTDPEYVIPNGVTSVGDHAFQKSSSLQRIGIPDSVTSIGEYAFSGCKALNIVNIPDTVTYVGEAAFYNCKKIETINFAGTEEQWNSFGLDSVDISEATVTFGK